MFDTLDDVLSDLNRRLGRAAKDRRSPMHTPAVITSDVDARTMVLREFNRDTFTLRFHTDTRAPKVEQIEADPRMAALFYDKGAKIQIRVRGTGAVLRDAEITHAAWDKGSNFARRCYLGEGPGAPAEGPTSGLPAEFEGVEPDTDQLVAARPNFAVLMITLTELDWLYLAHTGHARARFALGDDGWQGSWVTP